MSGVFVVVAAGGVGKRFSAKLPKQFWNIGGDFVIRKVIKRFLSIEKIDHIVCVVPFEFLDLYEKIFKDLRYTKLLPPVCGGGSRQESVRKGLQSIACFGPEHVLIHDAARCDFSRAVVDNVLESLFGGSEAVVPAVAPVDAVRYMNKTIDRSSVNLIQTPQGFRFDLIANLHEKYSGMAAVDDAVLCDFAGISVAIVAGELSNRKLTFESDCVVSGMRTGFGFDAHAFSADETKKLWLMGVCIEHERGLCGHSDADVGIHSIVDAILGAAGFGSIGESFPDDDQKYKNADSKMFLFYCANLLNELGYCVGNIDATVVCESPKISQYSEQMKEAIGAGLNVPVDKINIKGKTTEGLGFEGRKEGISAYASVLLEKTLKTF